MCRLLGIFSEQEIGIENEDKLIENFKEIAKQDRTIGHTHGDGWGIAWLEDNEFKVVKGTEPVWSSKLPPNITSNSYILHARKASVGGVSIDNTHPFQIEDLVLAHNGHINASLPHFHHRPIGETDSESLLAFLTDLREQGRDMESAIIRALDHIGNVFQAINLIIGGLRERTVWVLNYYNNIDEAHAIHYTIRYRIDGGKLIVASEPIDNGEWFAMSRRPLDPVLMRIPIDDPLSFELYSLKQSVRQ